MMSHGGSTGYFPNTIIEFVCKDMVVNQSIIPVPIDATNMIRLLQQQLQK